MTNPDAALDAYLQALLSPGDRGQALADFTDHFGAFITILDRFANNDMERQNYVAAHAALRRLEELRPADPFIWLRRIDAAAYLQGPSAFADIDPARLTDGGSLNLAAGILLAHGCVDAADDLAATPHPNIPPESVATTRARILAARGRLTDAVALLAPFTAQEPPAHAAAREQYQYLARLLRFEESHALAIRTSLAFGDLWDAWKVFDRQLFVFDFDGIVAFLSALERRHPHVTTAIADWMARMLAAAQSLNAAIAVHGPATGIAPAIIDAALSDPHAEPSRILWARRALVELCARGGVDAPAFALLSRYLPNWELAAVRELVLAAALRTIPHDPAVRRTWLHYLIAGGLSGEAAAHCASSPAPDDMELFHTICLLRRQALKMVPAFMDAQVAERLRAQVGRALPATSAGFRSVMQEHLAALGLAPSPFAWPADAPAAHGHPEIAGFRGLLATRTGGFAPAATALRRHAPPPPRPVLAISGQLRGFETCWASQYEHFVRPTGAPVVMSVWDTTKNALGRHARRLERMLPPDIAARIPPEERFTDCFERDYPMSAAILFATTLVDAGNVRARIEASGAAVIAVETEAEAALGNLAPPDSDGHLMKMYYKMARLDALIRADECASGEVFSHVIWLRPDAQILRLAAPDLRACLARPDIAWSSFTTETGFGDYAAILPRAAFTVLAGIYGQVVRAGNTLLFPWRPERTFDPRYPYRLDSFSGPDVMFDALLAAGYVPLAGIPRIGLELRGRVPDEPMFRAVFEREFASPARSANRH